MRVSFRSMIFTRKLKIIKSLPKGVGSAFVILSAIHFQTPGITISIAYATISAILSPECTLNLVSTKMQVHYFNLSDLLSRKNKLQSD